MAPTPTATAISVVRDAWATRDAAEVSLLHAVVDWTVEHRIDDTVVDERTFGDGGVLLGGVGCPLVAESHVHDLAVSLRLSSEAGCAYVGKVLELRYRLPRTWERVIAHEIPVWKALRLTEHTMCLTYEAARHIDRMLAPVLHSCTFAQIDRTVAEAIDLHDPDEAERRRRKAADNRSFDIHLAALGACTTGTVEITGTLEVTDALDLEQAVKDGAQTLGDLGCEEPLDVRRSMAVGEMARHQLALDLTSETPQRQCRGVVAVRGGGSRSTPTSTPTAPTPPSTTPAPPTSSSPSSRTGARAPARP